MSTDEVTSSPSGPMLPIHSDDPRWREAASGVLPEELLWYPSAGGDYRPVLEFSESRLAFHGLSTRPRLMVYTDVSTDPRRIDPGRVLHADAARGTRVVCTERIVVDADLCRTIRPIDTPWGDSSDPGAALLRIEAESPIVGHCESWVLHLQMSNLQFLLGWVGRHRVRFGTLVRVRMGLGMGGCTRCLSPAYPWLWWAGCRQLIADGEAHPHPPYSIRPMLGGGSFPDHPPAFTVQQTGPAVRWSGYTVRAFRLFEAEGFFASPEQEQALIDTIALPPWRSGSSEDDEE